MQHTGRLKPDNVNGNAKWEIFQSLGQKNIILFPIAKSIISICNEGKKAGLTYLSSQL